MIKSPPPITIQIVRIIRNRPSNACRLHVRRILSTVVLPRVRGISQSMNLSHCQHVNKPLKSITDNVSKCKNFQKPAECPPIFCKDDNLNGNFSGCTDKKTPKCGCVVKSQTLCPCIRKPVKEFTSYVPKG
ncbi:Hypothetical protein CINCED_3A008623 [Cinara cedri]|uniref:Uncharacterized protein n=1 Tax=Cinara cedri TaxID=506608 RepID=A0A5E4NC24_9HEMI|nr:Hypothetical protein CINCED_3A008623 [Cinara cedri]